MTSPTELALERIVIGERVRADLGDIGALAASILEIGLLHPVVVNEEHTLICGERRIRAFESLGLTSIPVRVVSLDSILTGEHAENEFRKDFSPSERVAIGKALEAELGERRGRPNLALELNVQDFAHLEGQKTQAIAAQKSGFGNPETYRQAKHVVKQAPAPIVEALDSGELSVNAAYELTRRAPDPVKKALTGSTISVHQAAAIQKNPDLRRSVESGERTPEQAASVADLMDVERKRRDAETGEGAYHAMTRLLTSITDVSAGMWQAVHSSPYNAHMGGSFRDDWIAAARHMLALAEGQSSRTIDAPAIQKAVN